MAYMYISDILFQACGQRKRVHNSMSNSPVDMITTVIRVFVDAFPHIPHHRRLMLFTKLISIEGDLSYLWRTLLLMTEQVVTKTVVGDKEDENVTDNVRFLCLVSKTCYFVSNQ